MNIGKEDFLKGSRPDYLLAVAIFLFHTLVNFSYSVKNVRPDATLVFMQPIRFLLEHGTFVRETSSNFYTGNPFFTIPIFEVFGYSPMTVKVFLSVMMGLSSVVFYLFYRKAFGRRKAVSLILILLTLNTWLTFRYMDWTYILFFEGVILYLYTSWMQKTGRELYIISFLSGLAFYFKTIVLYLMAGVALSALIEKKEELLLERTPEEIIGSGLLLVLGASPFIIYSFNVGFDYLQLAGISRGISEVVIQRFRNISILTWPGIIYSDVAVGNLPFYHLYLPLLFSGTYFSLKDRVSRRYAVIFLTIILLSINVVYRVSYRQMVILLPFVPIIIYANTDLLSLDDEQKSYLVSGLALAIIAISSLYTIPDTSYMFGRDTKWDVNPSNYDLKDKLDVEGPVAANYYDIYLSASYDMDMKPLYFLSGERERYELNPILLKRNASLADVPDDTTFILVEDAACNVRACGAPSELEYSQCELNGCGLRTSEIRSRLNLENYRDYRVEIEGHTYTVYEPLN